MDIKLKLFAIGLLAVMCHNLISAQNRLEQKIFFTAPPAYSLRFVDAAKQLDVPAIGLPVITTEIDSFSIDMKAFFNRIQQYDFVIFSSRKAIDAFIYHLPTDTIRRMSILRNTPCIAIGQDNDYLQEKTGIIPCLFASEASPMGIVTALKSRNISGKKVAVLAPQVIDVEEPFVVPQFVAALKQAGMETDRINAYRTFPLYSNITQLIAALENNRIYMLAFTSGGEIEALMAGIRQAGKTADSLFEQITIACFGPYTKQCAEKYGLNVALVASDFSRADGFAEAISRYLKYQP